MGGVGIRRILSPLAVSIFVMLAIAVPSAAHFTGIGPYLYNNSNCTSDKDPVNLVFTQWAQDLDLSNHFREHVPWLFAPTPNMKFLIHLNDCASETWQFASGWDLAVERSHFRSRFPQDFDTTHGDWSLAAAHRDYCGEIPPHVGSSFGTIRNEIKDFFNGQPGHDWFTTIWGNDKSVNGGFFCPEANYVADEGLVYFIEIPSTLH